MSKLLIEGGKKLFGNVSVQGSKNSVLPILAASVLCSGKSVIHNCPDLLDVNASIRILEHLGAKVKKSKTSLEIDSTGITRFEIPDFLMKEMRSSIIFLGAIASKMGKAKLSFPGGCELGPRPIDFHLKAFRQMGLFIDDSENMLDCYTDKRLKGSNIDLPFPSVGATENIMITASLAQGITIINNAAREPEICDLANFLNACGAKVYGAGDSLVAIQGVKTLKGAEHTVIPDRIVATTFMSAAAITGGSIMVDAVVPEHLSGVLPIFLEIGCRVQTSKNTVLLRAPEKLKPVYRVTTSPYPGFPTDAQALLLAVSTLADGESTFIESIFTNRFKHTNELLKLGANIHLVGKTAIVSGTRGLFGSKVRSFDLRGAAALIVAALGATGKTEVSDLSHLDRGYENIEEKLRVLGANIERV